MKKTRCKFVCTSIEHFPHDYRKVRMQAQYDQTLPEDQSFAKASPSGDLTIMVSNPDAFEIFVPGQAYYLDITPVAQIALDSEPAVQCDSDTAARA